MTEDRGMIQQDLIGFIKQLKGIYGNETVLRHLLFLQEQHDLALVVKEVVGWLQGTYPGLQGIDGVQTLLAGIFTPEVSLGSAQRVFSVMTGGAYEFVTHLTREGISFFDAVDQYDLPRKLVQTLIKEELIYTFYKEGNEYLDKKTVELVSTLYEQAQQAEHKQPLRFVRTGLKGRDAEIHS